ncbi:MAG: DNA topoisomerase 3, partial [Chloroflexota bacterium]
MGSLDAVDFCGSARERPVIANTRRTLIIAEKPSAARSIADALGGFRAAKDHLESDEYLLTWAAGHLVQLADAEQYNAAYKRWRLEDLPIVPDRFMLVPTRAAAQLKVIASLAKQAGDLVNACDAGREGELIFGYIYRYLKLTQPVRRLWAASLTREGIREAFSAMRSGADYASLYRAAECRSHGDWLTGINATRAFSRKYGDLLSVGRVQTPTLAMIVNRDREIRAFVATPYWELRATFAAAGGETYAGLWHGRDGSRIWQEEAALSLLTAIQAAQRGRITSVERKETVEKPPQLFDLTSLQREASRRYGLTAAATLSAAQDLYEAKLITYPRTDSRYLTHDMAPKLAGIVKRLAVQSAYASVAAGATPGLVRRWGRRVINDGGVTDHHAIIPTGEAAGQLAGPAARVYDLVVRRLLMQFYPEATYDEAEIHTDVAGETFISRGRRLLSPGWRVCDSGGAGTHNRGRGRKSRAESDADPAEAESEAILPASLAVGDEVAIQEAAAVRKETEPPRPFTDATLLAAMETAGRELDDGDLRDAMKRHGLGTPATRAATIERLREVGYIERSGRTLRATPKGEQLVGVVAAVGADVLLSPELTGEWERRIADVQSGDYDPDRFEREIVALVRDIVGRVTAAEGRAVDNGPVGKCPLCGSPVARRGRNWACAGGGCAFTLPGYL